MGRGHIDHCGVAPIGAKVSFGAGPVHEKATTLGRRGVDFHRTVGKRDFRTRQRKVPPRGHHLGIKAGCAGGQHRCHEQQG